MLYKNTPIALDKLSLDYTYNLLLTVVTLSHLQHQIPQVFDVVIHNINQIPQVNSPTTWQIQTETRIFLIPDVSFLLNYVNLRIFKSL